MKKRGFTLIELLIVIGIIAVLAGLLIPALGSARDKANRARCMANLKQIALAGKELMDEQKYEKLPVRSGSCDDWGQGAVDLFPYLNYNREIFQCPSNRDRAKAAEPSRTDLPGYAGEYTTYALNGYLVSCSDNADRTQSFITKFSRAAYAYDFPYDPALPRAHKGGINVGYLDGHAAWLRDPLDSDVQGGDHMNYPPESKYSFYNLGHSFDEEED